MGSRPSVSEMKRVAKGAFQTIKVAFFLKIRGIKVIVNSIMMLSGIKGRPFDVYDLFKPQFGGILIYHLEFLDIHILIGFQIVVKGHLTHVEIGFDIGLSHQKINIYDDLLVETGSKHLFIDPCLFRFHEFFYMEACIIQVKLFDGYIFPF